LHFFGSDGRSPSTEATTIRFFAWLRSQLSIATLAWVFASKYAARHTRETRLRQKRDTTGSTLNELGEQNLPWHYTFYRHFRSRRIIFFGIRGFGELQALSCAGRSTFAETPRRKVYLTLSRVHLA
jgi:hypothetical protein